MRHYIEFAVAVLILGALAFWQPEPGSFKAFIRGYCLTLIGWGVAVFGLVGLLRRVGLGRFAHGEPVMYLVIGVFLILCAFNLFTFYLDILRVWPLFSSLSYTGRRVACGALGIVVVFLGLTSDNTMAAANDQCQLLYAQAANVSDSESVDEHVPNSMLRPSRGRFGGERPPYNCKALAQW
jgi:hypothetical protein